MYTGCLTSKGAIIKVAVGSWPRTPCFKRGGESRISWNRQGPQGLTGPAGTPGQPGAPGQDAPVPTFSGHHDYVAPLCSSGQVSRNFPLIGQATFTGSLTVSRADPTQPLNYQIFIGQGGRMGGITLEQGVIPASGTSDSTVPFSYSGSVDPGENIGFTLSGNGTFTCSLDFDGHYSDLHSDM